MVPIKITCKNCNTFYTLDAEKIPFGGAKTRCKKCNTEILIMTKTDKIYYDIKNGANAKDIIEKHGITLEELKRLVIHFRQKGLLKKAAKVKPQSQPKSKQQIAVKTRKAIGKENNQLSTSFGQSKKLKANNTTDNQEKKSIEFSDILNLLKEKISRNEFNLNKHILKVENICAICLFIFFFFSWVKIAGLISVSGYGIPDGMKAIAHLGAAFSDQKRVDPSVHLYYLLYLIPIFSIVTIVFSITGKDAKVPGFIAAVLPIVFFLVAVFKVGTEIFDVLAIGFYLTIITSLVMIFYLIRLIKSEIMLSARG
jgi:predicted Zn finger-like uncharacterized protein